MSVLRLNDYKSFFPDTWRDSDAYETTLFILVELNEDLTEYKDVYALFDRKPTKIFRVQHPTAYLRYKVQSEFLEHEGISYTEKLQYYAIMKENLETCLTYNCDDRVVPGNFQSSPSVSGHNCVVIVQRRLNSSIDTDKNHYPTYVAEF